MRYAFRTLTLAIGASISVAGVGAAETSQIVSVNATNLSSPPTLRCRAQALSELASCAIFLPPGEKLNVDEIVADAKRWETKPERYGKNGDSVVFIKELSDEQNIGTTVYLTTDAPDGVYRVLVVADPSAPPFSEIHFSHALASGERQKMLADRAARDAQQQAQALAAAAVTKQRNDNKAALDALEQEPCRKRVDSAYHWASSELAPQAVFLDDLENTCVELPAYMRVYPVPYAGDVPLRFHARIADRMLIVDGLQGHFELRAGAQSVEVNYTGGKH